MLDFNKILTNEFSEQEYAEFKKEYRDAHYYDNEEFDLLQFAQLLKCFFRADRIELTNADSMNWRENAALSEKISGLIQSYLKLANVANFTGNIDNTICQNFEVLMKELIKEAKDNSSTSQNASQFLLGFLLHYNFQIKHQNTKFTMKDIYFAEASKEEQNYLQNNGSSYCFTDITWQKNQNFPSKAELKMLNDCQQNHFLPQFSAKNDAQIPLHFRRSANELQAPQMQSRRSL